MATALAVKDQLAEELNVYLQREDRLIPKLLAKVEQGTNIKREYFVYAFASIVSIYLMIGHGAELLCNFIGCVYPAYASLYALETEDKNDDTQWLTYWTVFGTIKLMDFASDKIMGVLPVYWLCKCVFLLWLVLPRFEGALYLHRAYFGPAFGRLGPACCIYIGVSRTAP